MPAQEPGKIRNIAVVGHRGTGKTSLVEALLFQSGAVNRLGTVEQGTTVSDWDDDETRRQMSLSAYVFQSVAWLTLLAPYTLALGTRFASPMLAGLAAAFAVWLVSLWAANMLERRGSRGPAETLLRRLTYGSAR